ncbi:MAG: hypothetical protein ACR2MX_10850 [Cyclobacteriaceae bacterium]
MRKVLLGVSLVVYTACASAPDHTKIDLKFSVPVDGMVVEEGKALKFKIQAYGGQDQNYQFKVVDGLDKDYQLDSLGNFSWVPDYDLTSRLEKRKNKQIIFEIINDSGQSAQQKIDLFIQHVNQPPVVEALKPLYIKYGLANTYQIDPKMVTDTDGDPLVFKTIPGKMPEGAQLSELGVFTWSPSYTQYKKLRLQPLTIPFIVEDQPDKNQTQGSFIIMPSQQDIPPQISVVPQKSNFKSKEDETINLKFYLSDPNGDDDLKTFDFIASDKRVTKGSLQKNSLTQWEFTWIPGYAFVDDSEDSVSFDLLFFVIDKSNKRSEQSINVTVFNAENIPEKDRNIYNQYRAALVRMWDLIQQLDHAEQENKKALKKAKKGKKNRTIVNASLGAITGISPVILEGQDQKAVAGIGGTTVATLGTLEATEVIGQSTDDLMKKLNLIFKRKGEIRTQGDIFARKYALRIDRRSKNFEKDLEKLVALSNSQNIEEIGLQANWKNKKKLTDNELQKTFRDFNPEQF